MNGELLSCHNLTLQICAFIYGSFHARSWSIFNLTKILIIFPSYIWFLLMGIKQHESYFEDSEAYVISTHFSESVLKSTSSDGAVSALS
uniref:Uncharacterized protein n=1 Tax=Populus trichocarpa TaxID=3694 RepID=U5FJH1_POPTR